MEYNLGIDSSEISLTIAGFALQNEFFAALSGVCTSAAVSAGNCPEDPQGLLYFMGVICGMIGLAVLFMSAKKMGMAPILGWCVLMIVIVVRPVGEKVFFTDLTGAPIFSKLVSYGGVVSVPDMDVLRQRHNIDGGVDFSRFLKEQSPNVSFDSVFALTYQLAVIDWINRLNEGLAVELLPFGARAVQSNMAFMDAAKAVQSIDKEAGYHIAEYAEMCGDASANPRVLYQTSKQVKEQDPESWAALKTKTISAGTALALYEQYARYRVSLPSDDDSALLPPLPMLCVDRPGASAGNSYACERGAPRYDADHPLVVMLDQLLYRPGGNSGWRGHASGYSAMQVLNDVYKASTQLEGNEDLLKLPVAMVVPVNYEAIDKNVRAAYASRGQEPPKDTCVKRLREEGSLTWWGISRRCGILSNLPGGGLDNPNDPEWAAWRMDALEFENIETPFGSGMVAVVNNCQDMHQVKSSRQIAATAMQADIEKSVGEALKDFGTSGENVSYAAQTAEDRATHVLNLRTAAAVERCKQVADPTYCKSDQEMRRVARFGSSPQCMARTPQEIERCTTAATKETEDALRYLGQKSFANSSPAAKAIVREALRPSFDGGVRTVVSEVGSFIAPVAVWFKGVFGGFKAGTYAEIMPQVISFGIAIAIFLTPLLFMLGLLLPMYALNAILLPLMLIAYLQLVKTTFILIRTVADTFSAVNSWSISTDDGERATELADIAFGNAYGAAFLLTAALMVMLRNPAAIIQQVAGKADGASSVSFQEVMAAGGALAVAKKAAGVAATVASGGTAAAVGKTVGAFTSGNMLRNQMTGLKSGYLSGAKQAQQHEAGAAELDALTDGSDESVGQQFRKGEQLKGMGAGEDLRDKLNPEIQAEKKKQFHRSLRDRAASQNGLKKLTRGTRRTLTKVDPETGKEYTEHEDLDPFLDDLEDAIAEGLLARDPVKYSNGQGAGLDSLKADASKHITAAIKKGVINRGNTGGHVVQGGKSNPKVVNAVAAKIETDILKVQPHQRPDPKPAGDDPK